MRSLKSKNHASDAVANTPIFKKRTADTEGLRNPRIYFADGMVPAKLNLNMSKKPTRPPESSKDIPVTVEMLHLVRDELRSEIRGLEHKVNSKFKNVDARFNEVETRFNEVDTRFSKVDARFDRMDSNFETMNSTLQAMNSSLHRMELMMEEQKAQNRIVMDGLNSLYHRQDRLEARQDKFEKWLEDLKRG